VLALQKISVKVAPLVVHGTNLDDAYYQDTLVNHSFMGPSLMISKYVMLCYVMLVIFL